MHIEKVRIKNFKSIGGKFVELDIGETGTTLIQGANGTAKSTIFHAITFGLFGKNSHTKGSSKSSIPTSELINDINKKELVVELYLKDHIIRRGLKPDIFEIIDRTDGKNIADKSSKTIDQKYLEDVILNGLNYDIYTKIVFLNAKATSTPFLYMTPTQRKDFIEYILDLRLVYFVGEALKSKISDMKLDLRDSDSKVTIAKNKVSSEQYKIEQDKIKLEEQKQKVEQLKAQKQSMIDEIDKEISDREDSISKIMDDYREYDAEHEESLWKDLDDQYTTIAKVTIPKYDDALRKIDKAKQKLALEKETYENNKEGFKLCGTCPTVSKIIGEFNIDEYETKIKALSDKESEITLARNELYEKLDDLEVKKDKIYDEKKDYRMAMQRVGDLQNQNKSSEEKKVKLEKLDSIELFEIDYDRLKELEQSLTTAEATHDKNVNGLEQLERIKKRVGDKSIKTEILEYYSPLLEDKINELLEKFFEDDDFSFNIEIDEEFNIEGFKNGKSANIFKLSEGQLSSVSLAITLAFQYLLSLKNSIDFKLFAVDEILDIALDSSRLDKIVQYMKDISKDKAVMIISHNSTLNVEYFDRVITTRKVNKFSEYEVS